MVQNVSWEQSANDMSSHDGGTTHQGQEEEEEEEELDATTKGSWTAKMCKKRGPNSLIRIKERTSDPRHASEPESERGTKAPLVAVI